MFKKRFEKMVDIFFSKSYSDQNATDSTIFLDFGVSWKLSNLNQRNGFRLVPNLTKNVNNF
jgi:hypothetical protein